MSNENIELAKITAMTYNGKHGKYPLNFKPEWRKIDHTDWFLGQDDKNVYIGIQGSRSDKDKSGWFSDDWDSNMDLTKDESDSGHRYHRGHSKQAKRIYIDKRTDDYIMQAIMNGKRLVVLGHSAGGGIAQILGSMLRKDETALDLFVFTMGQNKVFNKKARDYFDKNVPGVRIVNCSDPVTCLPIMNYWETKNEIQVGKERSIFYLTFKFKKWGDNHYDHNPIDYVKNLEKYYAEKDN